ncbi:hypothetical protein Ddye_009300 [Dipteronia dyeriana]|uniref:UBX domain-containing protein n=1 Tax=Dipteronia dyeriana TaxID=168575 RepID=A0AAE0CMR7_9ROSI|nr:hypothetical protein Ddye_009300 [Dipteronia dyeriana]
MESFSAKDKQNMVSSFLEIAVGQTAETGRQFLQATSWNLEEAIQLFYVGQDCVVRAPLPPVLRETLYDDYDAMLNLNLYGMSSAGFPRQEPSSMTGVWEDDEQISSTCTADTSRSDNLASLYRPPFHLMFNGSFEQAKDAASVQDKWLLVNLQSTKEFTSHMLNRDTWGNEAVSQTVSTNFLFWQVYHDTCEGKKVCTFYKLDSVPVVLVIDPITGQKMRSWCGMAVQPENLLEDLVPFMDCSPREDHLAPLPHKRKHQNTKDYFSASGVTPGDHYKHVTQNPTYPPLPEEPKGDRNLLCRVGVRLPDGRRTQRNFLRFDPIQLLWSYCYSQLEGDDTKPFRLAHAFPAAASKSLDYDSKLTFEESGLSNSIIYVTWE